MLKLYNFAAGPAMLPRPVLLRAQEQLLNFQETGMSIMEIGHRTSIFQDLLTNLELKLRELICIPPNYHLLFLPGGAQGHFSFIPMNLTKHKARADYLISGIWSERAAKFAGRYAEINKVPFANQSWQLNPDAAYVYYCPNETIDGVQIHGIPDCGNVPLVADMTSCILSKLMDVTRFGLIFASAQKNLGIAGITLLIIRDDLLGRALDCVPEIFNYTLQAEQHSLLNTIPVMPVYMMDLMVDWLNDQGGLTSIGDMNRSKAEALYAAIDSSNGFYSNAIDRAYRSEINIPFGFASEALLQSFLLEASENGLKSLNGHKLVGGARASLYNAMPKAGVAALIEFMNQFSAKHRD